MNLALLGLGLATIGVWVPVAVALLVLRGDLNAPDVPKPMRAVGLICVMWLSWVTSPLVSLWRRGRGSEEVSE